RGPRCEGRFTARGVCRRRQTDAVRAARRGRLRASDRMRQRRQCVVDAGGRQTKRDAVRTALGAWRGWPNEDPVGAHINLGQGNKPEIVGVVNDVKSFGLEEETHPDIYRPFAQAPSTLIAFAIRASGDPLSLVAAVKNAIYAVDKDQPVFKVITMEKLAAESITLRRVSMLLVGGLSALALILAAIGAYGVMSYTISQRQREIGLRLALGARASDVMKLVIGQGMKPASVGMIIGLLASFALTRLIKSLLFGVSATDPPS